MMMTKTTTATDDDDDVYDYDDDVDDDDVDDWNCHDVVATTRLDVHRLCHSSLWSRPRCQGGFLLRRLEDRSAPCALEVDDHTNRRVHKSVLVLVVEADLGEFRRCVKSNGAPPPGTAG